MCFARPALQTVVPAIFVLMLTGCASQYVPVAQLRAAQQHARRIHAENTQLTADRDAARNSVAALSGDNQAMVGHISNMENQLATANTRIDNLLAERSDLKSRYTGLLNSTDGSFVSGSGSDLSARHPELEFDPLTGLNRFRDDILFDLGSDQLRHEANPIIRTMASVLNASDMKGMRVLVVGHTDDQRIVGGATAAKHPTNWHLSTDRAAGVVLALAGLGVENERLSAMGYSKFQPLMDNVDDVSRQRNRRVEVYVVPQETSVAMWEPGVTR